MKTLQGVTTALLLFLATSGQAWAKIPRDQSELRAFQRANACPSTGQHRGKCPGWQIDHIEPLCASGRDHRDNLQWLTIEEHRYKTRTDVRVCRGLRKQP